MGRIRDFVSGKDRTEETCAFVAKVFASEATTMPLFVPHDMLDEASAACPTAWMKGVEPWEGA